MPPVISELLKHKFIVAAFVGVGVILIGSVAYVLFELHPPTLSYATAAIGAVREDVSASGTVMPVENPNLSFGTGGKVAHVSAAVGQKVAAGTVLASLDTGVLSATLAGAQAHLDELVAGPRDVDIASKQTALASAKLSLSNAQATFDQSLIDTATKAQAAVAATDPLFSDPNGNATLTGLVVQDYDTKLRIDRERVDLNSELRDWLTAVAAPADPSTFSARSDESLAHLNHVRAYLDDLATNVTKVTASDATTQASIESMLLLVNTARTTVNGLVLSLTSATQSLASQNLNIQSAQDALNQTLAGTRSEEVAAQQAQVAGIVAQIRQQEVIAPFSGTVAAVNVKAGDTTLPGAVAVSLVPDGKFQVEVYVTELDVAKLAPGDVTDVTLDAYGASRVFPATVATIDTAPSSASTGAPAYKVTLVFANADPAVATGMHANAVVHGSAKSNVLVVPTSAIIHSGTQTFVLKRQGTTTVKTPVTLGLVGSDTVEIVSGLSAGDEVATH